MRPPFYMDKIDPDERAQLRRWQIAVGGGYGALALLLVAGLLVAKTDLARSQMAKLGGSSDAVAAERLTSTACAARDLKLVTLIEEAGEAKAVPGERLAEAFFTMVKARDLCRAGRVADALAVYDSITVTPVRSSAK